MNFAKSEHTAPWGSESWEISAHPADPSVIADGEEKGRWLNEIYVTAFDSHIRGLVATVTKDDLELWLSQDGARTFKIAKDGMQVSGSVLHKLFLGQGRLFMLTRGSGVWMRQVEK